MDFRTGRFCLALALILAYGTVPVFAGHGVGVIGMLLPQASIGAWLGWAGIGVLLIGAFRRSEVWSIVGPLLLSASIWLTFAQLYPDEFYRLGSIPTGLFWSGLFHVLLVVSMLRALVVIQEARRLEQE